MLPATANTADPLQADDEAYLPRESSVRRKPLASSGFLFQSPLNILPPPSIPSPFHFRQLSDPAQHADCNSLSKALSHFGGLHFSLRRKHDEICL